MPVKITTLRKTSKGISGTYENAEHHAKDCLPLIKILEEIIEQLGTKYDFSWRQGNNVHVIERSDESKIVLRPFVSIEGEWGIDAHFKTSRRESAPLLSMRYVSEALVLGIFLEQFLSRGEETNTYGKRPDKMSLKEE